MRNEIPEQVLVVLKNGGIQFVDEEYGSRVDPMIVLGSLMAGQCVIRKEFCFHSQRAPIKRPQSSTDGRDTCARILVSNIRYTIKLR